MTNNAFTAGVKPGGLTTSTEIRILLCYLLCSVNGSLTRAEIENALLGEELVNYFELADALGDLCDKGHLALSDTGAYTVTESGRVLATTLESDVPRSVREKAVSAAISAQVYNRQKAQHHARYEKTKSGYLVHCSIEDLGETVFAITLYMPDELSAKAVEDRFIREGGTIYGSLLSMLVEPPKTEPQP
ncbi:MAG: DUF4364 family protein [Pygmaiobacter sp.]